jgi:hypothetical protein
MKAEQPFLLNRKSGKAEPEECGADLEWFGAGDSPWHGRLARGFVSLAWHRLRADDRSALRAIHGRDARATSSFPSFPIFLFTIR